VDFSWHIKDGWRLCRDRTERKKKMNKPKKMWHTISCISVHTMGVTEKKRDKKEMENMF
jgi:hypothetical protein